MIAGMVGFNVEGTVDELMNDSDFVDDLTLLSC